MIFTVKKTCVFEYFAVFLSIFFIGLILSAPAVCAFGAKRGLKISADILVPSLFPFAIPVVFLINTPLYKNSKYRLPILFVFSLVGGYPIGGKLISELHKCGLLDKNTATKILPFCVNAGPAFIVIAVGKGILGSIKVGYILLISHTLASIILALIFLNKDLTRFSKEDAAESNFSVSESIVSSVHIASGATISISAFVIAFSVINEYISYHSAAIKPLKYLLYFTEVTSAVTKTKNIYFISFLLGFAGLSIWMQVYSVSGELKAPFAKFSAVRTAHGILSMLITAAIFKAFKISVNTLSNNKSVIGKAFYSDYTLALSLIIMALLLLIKISSKKHSGNLLKDVV